MSSDQTSVTTNCDLQLITRPLSLMTINCAFYIHIMTVKRESIESDYKDYGNLLGGKLEKSFENPQQYRSIKQVTSQMTLNFSPL